MVFNFKIVCLALLLISLSACNPNKQDDFPWGSFSGNGEHFSYTKPENGRSSIFIVDKLGNEIKHLRQPDWHILGGNYVGDSFYHISHRVGKTETDPSTSKIHKCDLPNYDCREIYSSRGSIICLFGLKNRIFFFHSKTWQNDARGRSYNQFVIRSTAKNAGGAITEYGRSFVSNMCPVVFADTAYGSFSFPFESTMQMVENDVFFRSDRIVSIVEGNIEINQIDLDPRGSVNLLIHIPDLDLNYMGFDSGKGYVYGNCLNLFKCEIKNSQTNPVIIGNTVYFGEWDYINKKMSIKKIGEDFE